MANAPESKDSTTRILLLIFGSLACLAVIVCCGGGLWLFVKGREVVQQVQEAMKDAALTNPDDIRRLTGEMTEITIPPEFVPKSGSAVFGIRSVMYEWSPTGVSGPAQTSQGGLTLMSFKGAEPNDLLLPDMEAQFTNEELAKTFKDFTRVEHQFDIRQQRCKFYIIRGEVLANAQPADPGGVDAGGDDEGATDDDSVDDDMASDSDFLDEEQWAGQRIVRVIGRFPGKDADCSLMINLKEDQYNEDKILAMLKSIR